MKKQRKHYTPEEKIAILRRHLLEKEPISNVCDEFGLQRTSSTAGRRSSRGFALSRARRSCVCPKASSRAVYAGIHDGRRPA